MSMPRAASAVLLSLTACSAWSSHEQAPPPTLPILALPWLDVPADAVLAGGVRDPQGAPIAGAQVCAWHHAPEQLRQDDRTPRCATTDQTGAYAITGLVPAAYHVHASAPTFQPGAAGDARAVGAGARRVVDLVLDTRGVLLRGRVLDIDGAPIAGAWIHNDMPDHDTDRGASAGAHSDSAGEFGLWVSPGPHIVTAEAPGFTATTLDHDAELAPVRIILGPASSVTGSVVDAATRVPIAGARIQARHAEPRRTGVAAVAYTDAAGAFDLSRLPPGSYALVAETGNRQGEGARVVRLGLGQTTTLPPIALTTASSVRGRVHGCPGGRFRLTDLEPPGAAIGVDGEVFLPAVAPGEYAPAILCHEAAFHDLPAGFAVGRDPLTDLQWRADEPMSSEPRRTRTRDVEIRGTVVDSAGQPVVRANVGLHTEIFFDDTVPTARTDVHGAFVLHGVSVGSARVSAQRPNIIHWIRGPMDPGERVKVTAKGLHDLRLTLPGAARPIRGRVVQSGSLIPGAVVTLHIEEMHADDTALLPDNQPPLRLWGAHDELTRTDAHGRFEFPTTFEGSRYTVWAYPRGGGDAVRAHVDAGQDITLDVPRTAGIAGTIAGPVPRTFAILLLDADGETRERRLFRRTDGRWGFEAVPPGAYDLRLVSPGVCATTRVDLAAGDLQDIELVPGKLGGLRGRLVDGDNQLPEPGVEVIARAGDPRLAELADELGAYTAITDADGRFELLGICEGPLDVRARTELRDAAAPATIHGHAVTELALVLHPTPQETMD